MLVKNDFHIENKLSNLSRKKIFECMVRMYEPLLRSILFDLRFANKVGEVKIEHMTSGFSIWQKIYQDDICKYQGKLVSSMTRFNQNESNVRHLLN